MLIQQKHRNLHVLNGLIHLLQINKIMNSITGSILIDFQNIPATEEQKDYHKQVYGAIKLQLSQMEKYQKVSHFNICEKCGMILTREDKGSVYDWQQINSNVSQFKEIIQKYKDHSDAVVVWICAFCQKKNIIECNKLKFAKNCTRFVQKQPSLANEKKDPILLIVFDISGSMEELLTNEQQNVYSMFLERIKTTKIYKKIVAQEEQQIKEILQKQNIKIQANDTKNKYKDYLKKNKLLMGLTEWLVNELNPNNSANQKIERRGGYQANKQKKNKVNKSIGFMFFNSNVILEPTTGKSAVVVCDSRDGFGAKTEKMIRQRVNFDDFDNLFQLGATYGEEYTTKLNEFKFDNLQIKFGDQSHGQTALGPALVMALGVISKHGAGSSIVVVTDGIGNKGIFDQSQKWQQATKLLKYRLQKHKCFLTMLECRNINQASKQKDLNNIKTCIDEFCARNDEMIAKKINILVDKNKTAQNLIEDIRKKMAASINRQNIIWTNEVKIKSQNGNIVYEEDSNKLSQKLINHQQPLYINPKFDQKKLKERDYIHHFMTQAVIRYQNTQTGEQSIFMTYILQKFIRFNKIRKSTLKKLDNEKTFHDMMEYLSVEQQNYDISNIPLSFVKKTFRDTLMFSKSIYNRSLRFPMKSHNQTKEEDVVFFTEIFRKNQDYKEVEEDDQIIRL